jgi:hypothetical protein
MISQKKEPPAQCSEALLPFNGIYFFSVFFMPRPFLDFLVGLGSQGFSPIYLTSWGGKIVKEHLPGSWSKPAGV